MSGALRTKTLATRGRELLGGLGASLTLHLAVAAVLAVWTIHTQSPELQVAIESIFETERTPEEFTRELSLDTQVSETMNFVAGGAVSAAIAGGTGAPAVSQVKIDESEQLQDPTVAVNMGDVTLPGLDELGTDLGESQIEGEPAAAVEGYAAALSRITQELLRMMREQKVLVVWLFDESESMKDDQQEIRAQFHKVYEELGLAVEADPKVRGKQDVLLSAVHSFGESMRVITPKPTADIPAIRAAIDQVAVDPSGRENVFAAVNKIVDQYRSFVTRGRRKLVIVIVTDESGDDGKEPLLDEAISKAQRLQVPVYVLGREAVFGYPFARMRWLDPKYGLEHWLLVNRGPESAAVEALQFDGLHERWDANPSGFAPYEQARLAKETGGIFFVLPHEEQNLVLQSEIDRRKFSFLDMKEYIPQLVKRREYVEQRAKSKFRTAVWDAVRLLDPQQDPELRIPEGWYSSLPEQFRAAGEDSFKKGLRTMGLLNQAAQQLEAVRPLREQEDSQRWRANYDLVYAQVLAYRVRLFQFLLVMDGHLTNFPTPQDRRNNVWNIARIAEMQAPTERQIKLTKVDLDELKRQLESAQEQFEFVRKAHPGTPWASRAEYELNQGFGMKFVEGFRDPRYDRVLVDVKLPSL